MSSNPEAKNPTTVQDALALGVFVAVSFLAAGLGVFSPPDAWYAALDKPPLNPPNWIFGPVWTVLYVLMAIAGWLVWLRRKGTNVRGALALFAVQLALNAAWSPLFFGAHHPGLALLDLMLLWAVLLATLVAFWRVRPVVGALLVPYQLWVTFAGYLNLMIWWLNR